MNLMPTENLACVDPSLEAVLGKPVLLVLILAYIYQLCPLLSGDC
jgi:hypothetical protein